MNITDRISSPERLRREVLSMCQLVAPLPEVVVRIIALLGDPDTDAAEVERHLALDPALAARLLAQANSPLYGLSGEVRTVSRAIVVVGFAGIRSLLLATTLTDALNRDFSGYGHSHHGLWRHSLAVAAGARSLSKSLHQSKGMREEMFVAGLLHDLGKMVLVRFVKNTGKPLDGVDVIAEERERFGIDHAEVGVLIAAKWNLGAALMDLIAEHHALNVAQPEEFEMGHPILRVAQALAHDLGYGYLDGRAPQTEPDGADLQRLHITEEPWQVMRTDIEEDIHRAIAAMEAMSGS